MKTYAETKTKVYEEIIQKGYRHSISMKDIEQMAAVEFAKEYIKKKVNERVDYCENQITWMTNVNYIDKQGRSRILKEQIEFLNDLIASIK